VEPLITNRLDPALLRVIEKRGSEHELPRRRRRPSPAEAPAEKEAPETETTRHEIDDLA
jgi:hypothetical protein